MTFRHKLSRRLAGLCAAIPPLVAACGSEPTGPAGSPSLIVFPGGDNSPPAVTITTPIDGQLVAMSGGVATVHLAADLTDPDVFDTHTCDIDWEAGTTAGLVEEADGAGICTGNFDYTTPGVYTIGVTVTDPLGETATDQVFVVVYDPTGGFVTGGGWIDAAPGSYPLDPSLAGKATFGFVAKYKRGASTPDGNTEFQFHAAGMNFHSIAYDWLIVAGGKAMYKGTGTVNGTGSYQFMMSAIDGSPDRLRMRIWSDAGVLFDNQVGDTDDADPLTALSGGSIVIHGH
ncbi:MAG: hypothetical protein AB7R55_21220 [Gemmatimonadales bacterium]